MAGGILEIPRQKAEEEGEQGDSAYCIGSAPHGLELEEPSKEPPLSEPVLLYTRSITQQIKGKLL